MDIEPIGQITSSEIRPDLLELALMESIVAAIVAAIVSHVTEISVCLIFVQRNHQGLRMEKPNARPRRPAVENRMTAYSSFIWKPS